MTPAPARQVYQSRAGVMAALRAQGWTRKQIADGFGCSVATVNRVLGKKGRLTK